MLQSIAILASIASEPSCSQPSDLAALKFERGSSSISVVTQPGDQNLVVPIRTRGEPWLPLVYSSRPELPDSISSPRTATFPLISYAASQGEEPETIANYAAAAADLLKTGLTTYGAVIFRGLPLGNSSDYSAFVDELEPHLGWKAVQLGGGGTQRKELASNVRTASEEPERHTIEPHMDMAHSVAHPKRIGFFCAAGPPPGVGGETVLTDMRGVYATLDALGVPAEFAAHGGVAYRKRLWSAEHVSHAYTWQQFFFTQDLDVAAAEVRKRDPDAHVDAATGVIDFEERLPAIATHPATGEPLWFNGVHTNHKSYYEEAEHVDTSGGSPMNTVYADGTPIPEETIAVIRAAMWNHSVAIRMATGDFAVVDNMLTSHGRMGWLPPHPRKMLLTHFQDA